MGVVVLDVDSTILMAHSNKENAAATYKHTYGFHPILVTCDNTNELLAVKLRPGNAGANTAADHLSVLADAIAQIPAAHRLASADPWRQRGRDARRAGLADRPEHPPPHRRVLDRLVDRRGRTRRYHRAARVGVDACRWPPTGACVRKPRWPS